ncbi:transmembrane protein 69 [Anomalospiza imberbis]|uniref:transmembrane protein 69 n=1 Tax=Anomalospiza imberbis TaxID=187417 RepID=UPI00358FD5B0
MRWCRKPESRNGCTAPQERFCPTGRVSLLCQTDCGPRAESDWRCCPRYRLGGPFRGPAEHDGPCRFPPGPVALGTGRRRSAYEGAGSRRSWRVRVVAAHGGSCPLGRAARPPSGLRLNPPLPEPLFSPSAAGPGAAESNPGRASHLPPGIDKTNKFPLIQRCCFNTPFKLQKLPGASLLLHGKNKTTCSSLALQLQRDARPLSTPLSLKPASVYTTQLRAFHASLPISKKKTPAESEAQSQEGLGSLKDCPKPALYLSLGGLIPFVAVPLASATQGTYCPELAFAQVAYGAATASFLGGVRWGFALPANSPAKPDWLNLANGTAPALLACQALLFKDVARGAAMLTLALGIALHYDTSFLPPYPRWFKILRVVGTVVMILSLLATVALKAFLEGEQSDDRQTQQNIN